MADEDIFKPEGAETTGPRRKRAPVTIDLAAEPDANIDPPRVDTEAPLSETTASESEPTVETPPEPEAEVVAPPVGPSPRSIGNIIPIVAAALGGGLVGGLLVAFLAAPNTDTITQASVDSRFNTMAARLDGLESAVAAKSAETAPADTSRLDALDQQIAELKSTIANLPTTSGDTAAPVDLGPLEQRLAAVEARPEGAVAPPIDLSPLSSQIGALSARLDQLEAHPPSDPKTEAAARTIALTTLRQAARASGPFGSELGAFKALGGDDAAIAALQPLASDGAPSSADLVASFPAIAGAIRTASMKADPNAGLFDRLAASASSLVSVKPAGPVEGATTTAIVSRMEANVATGDLAGALREAEGLDAAAREPLADWAAKARLRVEIDAAMQQLADTGPSN